MHLSGQRTRSVISALFMYEHLVLNLTSNFLHVTFFAEFLFFLKMASHVHHITILVSARLLFFSLS